MKNGTPEISALKKQETQSFNSKTNILNSYTIQENTYWKRTAEKIDIDVLEITLVSSIYYA